jgi:hypothetical protein
LVGGVARTVRWRRAIFYGLRGTFYGAFVALVPLLLKGILGPVASAIAGGLITLGAAAGAAFGYLLSVPPREAARLVDRAFDLRDRTATALEWSGRSDRGPLVAVLVEDAAARLSGLDPSKAVPRRWPLEGKLVPAPVLIAVALWLAPPIPIPSRVLPAFQPFPGEEREASDRDAAAGERLKAERDRLTRLEIAERDAAARQGSRDPHKPGDFSAVFKDTSLGVDRPDFNSFLKRGDERLRMLERVDRLPDLKGDFTQSRSKVIFQRMKALSGGLRPDQFSPEKMREILEEMRRLGQKGGDWGGDTFEGMDALNQGENDRAWKAMEKALNKMRALEDRDRSGKNLRGGPESDRRGSRGRERPEAGDEFGERDLGEGEMGSLPGKGANPIPKGDATARLRSSPFDTGVEGESRAGRRDGFDTNMLGRGATLPSTMRYLSLFGQYRKMMEEALAREQVPRDYQGHVKEYFQSLEER